MRLSDGREAQDADAYLEASTYLLINVSQNIDIFLLCRKFHR